MKGVVKDGFVAATVPKLVGESVHRYRIVRWVNGPQRGYTKVEYMGAGRWAGPRCIVYTEIRKCDEL